MDHFTTVAYAGLHYESPEVLKSAAVAKRHAPGLLLRGLAGGVPGTWASDHRREAEFFNGWNGVAIHQKCLQLMQADCAVYRDMSPQAKRKRRTKAYTTIDESQELPESSPLVKLLKRPNPWQSGGMFRYSLGQQLDLTGKGMIWNVPNAAAQKGLRLTQEFGIGKTSMRIVVPTAFAAPVPPGDDLPTGGWRIQPVATYWGADPQGFVEMFGGIHLAYGKVIPHEQMQIISWPHPLYTDDGCSPTGRGAQWIDGSHQVGVAQWSQLKNGADPSLHISVGEAFAFDEDMADRYGEKLRAKYGGPENSGRVMVTQDTTVTPLSMSPKDMSYTEAFVQYRDAIMALHGAVPLEADTYAGFFAKVKQFTELVIQPVLNMLADEDSVRLAPEYGEGLTIEYTAKSIDDPEVMDRETATLVSAKAIRINEVRARYGLPPDPEGEEWAGAAQATAMNVNGALSLTGQQGGGFGLKLPTEDASGVSGMPSLSLPASNGAGPVNRLSLNGKRFKKKLRKNCGTGAGGFQEGNTCASGGGGDSSSLTPDAPEQNKKSPEFAERRDENGRKIEYVSSQLYRNPAIIDMKRRTGDYAVQYVEFEYEGRTVRYIIDGHHSMEAAAEDGVKPDWQDVTSDYESDIERLGPTGFMDEHNGGDGFWDALGNSEAFGWANETEFNFHLSTGKRFSSNGHGRYP